MPSFTLPKSAVYSKLLESTTSDSFKPRCQQRCPMCKMFCSKPHGHSGKCDTSHQPQGLAGIRWLGGPNASCVLSETCLECVTADSSFIYYNNKHGKYRDFEKEFPPWELPGRCTGKHKLQEFIFFNCQPEIVAFFTGTKRCASLPPHFNHNLTEIEEKLKLQAQGQ
eukprot:2927805-Amphidinium_carterae.1